MSNEDTSKKIEDAQTEEGKLQHAAEVTKTEEDQLKVNEKKEDGISDVNDVKDEASVNDDTVDGNTAPDKEAEDDKEELKKPAKKRPVVVNDDVKNEEGDEEDDEDAEEKDEEMKNGMDEKDTKKRDEKEVKKDEVDIPNGKGTVFSECPRIDFFIKQKEIDQLKKLHQVIYGKVGKPDKIKGNLLLFKGFDYEPESDAYIKKKQFIGKLDVKHLKDICDILDVEKKGRKEEIVNRIMDFLMEPKDSGKALPPQPSPRPKRTSAVKANNRGYAGLDADDSDDDEGTGRGRGRATGRRNKSRPSYKDESSSEDERRARRGGGRRYADSDDAESEPELTPSESDSDSPRKKKTSGAKSKGKTPVKRKTPAKGAKKPPARKARKKSDSEESEGLSESEDEPLQKKSKKPPTDDEIKKYVKQILDGANLEEITMKTVCKQVYGRYPEHDLTHKKDLIKTTVKSLIAT